MYVLKFITAAAIVFSALLYISGKLLLEELVFMLFLVILKVLESSSGEIVISLKSALNMHFSSGEKRIPKLVEGIPGIVISD